MPRPFNWSEYFGEWPVLDLEDEFEILQSEGPKYTVVQARRIKHIEEHLRAGDIHCECYRKDKDGETVRTLASRQPRRKSQSLEALAFSLVDFRTGRRR